MGRIHCQNLRGDFMSLEGKRISELTEVSRVNKSSKLPIDTGGEEALSITLENLMESGVNAAIEALQFITWVDVLPPTGSTKYLYVVPREEVDKDGNKIAALYLWDGTEWRGAGAFSLNIDPATLATKDELAGYLPLSGGTLSGNLILPRAYSDRYSIKNGYNVAVVENPFLTFGNNAYISLIDTRDEHIKFRKRSTGNTQYELLSVLDKAVANGVASLDANSKVPSEQIPVATTSALGGVKPDGTTITVAEDGTLNANTDTLATKAELAGYLPLTGGIINGELKIVGPKSTIRTYSGNETSGYTYLELKAADNNQALIALTNNTGETRFRQKGKDTVINNLTYNKSLIISSALTFDNNKVLDASDKAVANGVASLDANAKVPSEQIPVATYSALGGVKPDGTTITVTEDGAISAAISGEVFATKAELQALDSSKADTSLSNVLANIDYVVESQVNSDGSWYRKYKSGWLEQGGLAKSNEDVTVTLLKPFADTNYSVQCTNRRLSTSDGWGWIFVLNMTATSFMARACYAGGDITNINAMWEAKGMGAN